MNKELKKKWVAALRSGGYQQGRHVLYSEREDTYCCLGVLCDIQGVSKKKMNQKMFPSQVGKGVCGFSGRVSVALSKMNDEGIGFTDIAKYINKTL